MKFSVALIAKDEANTLPKLLESLRAFRDKGGEVVLLDTGSTDGTPALARSLGCIVSEVGDKYMRVLTKEQADAINEPILRNGEGPGVSEGDRCFDFAAARNAAAELASNDFVMTPDCDERVQMNLEKLESLLADDVSLVWCKIHAGSTEWNTTRFYNRKKMKWSGITHEWLGGEGRHVQADLETFSLYHYQEHKDERPQRITGLALEAHLVGSPRSLFYYGRDLFYRGKYRTAIEVFKRQLALRAWIQEQAEALAFMGDCYAALGEEDNAYQAWHTAWTTAPDRRIGLMRAAKHAYEKADWKKVAVYAVGAMQIPFNHSYIEDMALYSHLPYEYLYPAVWQLGRKADSRVFYNEAKRLNPNNPKTIGDARWYADPLVSIIIPTLGREEKLKRCLEAIKENADYENYEVIVKQDKFPPENTGVPKLVAQGVAECKGELVMYLGNDCVPQPGFLRNAVAAMRNFPELDGLVGLNDTIRTDKLATHWLGSKKLLGHIGGEFFHTGYYHSFCDNELTERAHALGKYVYCEDAVVKHDWTGTDSDDVYKLAYKKDRFEHDQQLYNERRKQYSIDLSKAMAIQSTVSLAECTFLATHAKKAKVCIEIGSWIGRSGRAMADNTNGVVYCVDNWTGSAFEPDMLKITALEDGKWAANRFKANMKDLLDSGKVKMMQGDTLDQAKKMQAMGIKADLIFIDAGHTKEEVEADLRAWYPLLAEGGTFCGHDYTYTTGVSVPVDEFCRATIPTGTSMWVKNRVYDCFTFFNELDLLEMRLNELDSVVDYFVISEGDKTHSGKAKEYLLEKNWDRFAKFHHKIQYIKAELPEDGDAWVREKFQRNELARGLVNCESEDVIIISDLDEIPNPGAIKDYRTSEGLRSLEMDLYYYWMNCKQATKWRHAKVFPYRMLTKPDEMRFMEAGVIPNGGWHFSYLGGPDKIVEKLEAYAHQEYNTEHFKDKERIKRKLADGMDIFDRQFTYSLVAVDDTFPKHVDMLKDYIHG